MGIVMETYIENRIEEEESRRAEFSRYQAYYDGDHDVTLPAEVRNVSPIVDNACQTIVDDTVTLLVGAAPDVMLNDSNPDTDDKEPQNWLRNEVLGPSHFNSLLVKAARIAGIKGEAWLHSYFDDKAKAPRIRVLRPDIVYPIFDPEDYETLLHVLIKYPRDDGSVYAAIWSPDTFEEYETNDVSDTAFTNFEAIRQWAPANGKDKADQPNPYGFIPFRQLKGKAVDGPYGVSDLQAVVSLDGSKMGLQDALNKALTDLFKISDSQAFQHLWGAGIKADEASKLQNGFSKFWHFADPQAKVGAVEPSDPQGLINTIQLTLDRISKVTATPVQTFQRDGTSAQSGKALRIQRFDQIQKINEKRTLMEEAVVDVLRMVLQMEATLGTHNYVGFAPTIAFHDGIPTDALEQAQIHEIEARNGWKSKATIMGERGIEDVEAEQARIAKEELDRQALFNQAAAAGAYPDEPDEPEDPEGGEA